MLLSLNWIFIVCSVALTIVIRHGNCSSEENSRGILTLDQYTFDKVISKFHYSLIKFDHAWPIGLDHDAFVSLGRQLSSSEFDIAIANIQTVPESDEESLARRYAVPYGDFPALRLFVNHEYRNITVEQFRQLRPIVYPTERDFNVNSGIVLNPITMRLFLWTQINIRTPLPNCTKELDELAEEFVYLLEQNKVGELQRIQDAVDVIYTENRGAVKHSAGVYAKFIKKASDQGLPFFNYEHGRIRKLLGDNFNLSEDKKRQLRVAFNILQSFRLRHYESMLKENENARIRDLNPARIEL